MQTVAGMQRTSKQAPAALRNAAKQWVIKPADDRCGQLAKSLKISPVVAQVLLNRGIADVHTASAFLRPKLTELIPPEKMPGATKAAAIIKQAIEEKKKITVYGDYDVDGITGISILWHLIQILKGDVDFYVPHRVDEGYGLNAKAVEHLSRTGTKLIVTVDCGITAVESAKLAKKLGIDLIITDHHRFSDELPDVKAIVHPAIDKSYPNQASAGAMVAFKLAWELANKFNTGARLDSELREFMLNAASLAAMGTVADVVDLKGENRILVSFGLKSLAECKLSGIKALIETAGLTETSLDSYSIGFRLAPMLNAAGRMGHARLAVELLTSDNDMRSMKIAEYLKQQNEQRRRCERKIFKCACEMITQQGLNHPDHKTIVLANADWHIGVIGIVASRIVDKYHRPTILINSDEPLAQGSGRSIEGFDILSAVKTCSKHLKNFGGHAMAAGVRLPAENIEQFANGRRNTTGTFQSRDGKAASNVKPVRSGKSKTAFCHQRCSPCRSAKKSRRPKRPFAACCYRQHQLHSLHRFRYGQIRKETAGKGFLSRRLRAGHQPLQRYNNRPARPERHPVRLNGMSLFYFSSDASMIALIWLSIIVNAGTTISL